MFEHFSERAIEVMALARFEAQRLEFSQFDSAHVLIALAAEEHGVAARALKAVGFDVRRGRLAAERSWGRGYEVTSVVSPTEEVARLVEAAMAIAGQSEPLVVDTQDLLRAVLGQPASRGFELLENAGISPDELMRQLLAEREHLLAGEISGTPAAAVQRHFHPRLLSPLARRVLERATAKTVEFGHRVVGTEQLLVGLLELTEGAASDILRRNGLLPLDIEAIAHRVIGRGSGTISSPSRSGWVDEALERAWQTARRDQHEQIGTCHLLSGLLDLDEGGALYLMDLLKINLSAIGLDVEQFLADRPHEAATS